MVDTGTYNKMSSNEQNEFNKYSSSFIRAVQKSDAVDGYEFEQKYQVQGSENNWFIAKVGSNKPFAGITTKSKAVAEALLSDAAQNYGR
jgi:hypothetical protein